MEQSNHSSFTLENESDVAKFEALLDQYVARKFFLSPSISLLGAYRFLKMQRPQDGGQVFTALLDLYINFILLEEDFADATSRWNAYFSKGKMEGGSVLDSKNKFFGKMEIHRFNTSYIFRYRALWDKIMGFLIIYYLPDEYETFHSSDSKKTIFEKLRSKLPLLIQGDLKGFLEHFDDKFRTPEAHGTGRLRKFSFLMKPLHETPVIELLYFSNIMKLTIIDIGHIFNLNGIGIEVRSKMMSLLTSKFDLSHSWSSLPDENQQ